MTLSFRARVVLLVLAVAVLPLGLVGLWLTGSAARSGEALLRSRLEGVLETDARAVELAWIRYRSALLDLAETPEVQRALRVGSPPGDPPPALRERFAALDPAVEGLVVRDRTGRELWQLGRVQPAAGAFTAFGALLQARVPLFEIASAEPLGQVTALIPINALRSASAAAAAIGALVTARDPETGALLLPAPFDPGLLSAPRFQWNAEDWITVARLVAEPRVELIAAAPVAPFAAPFRAAARRGIVVLVIAALVALAVAMLITARLTRSLEQLAGAADAVAGGQLDRRVDVRSDDEVGQVARAFNAMITSLRRTLDQLAERESLAAVNEFAAALAHEVRNPLTAIRIDLQEVEERLPSDSPLRALQARVLLDIERLDRTVGGALETARTGHVELTTVDLREPIAAAVRAATPAVVAREAQLTWRPPAAPCLVRGDADALERVLLNLLLNAAEAVDPKGAVVVEVRAEEADAVVTVHDNGRGMTPEVAAKVFDPFFTTRPGGTGVGLAVARRIVTAHGGSIAVNSEPGRGTTVEVRLSIGTA